MTQRLLRAICKKKKDNSVFNLLFGRVIQGQRFILPDGIAAGTSAQTGHFVRPVILREVEKKMEIPHFLKINVLFLHIGFCKLA